MVAKIICGKSIKGAMNYNEKKVKEGKAELLYAHRFPSDNLSFEEKLNRFLMLTKQNQRSKTNAVHISLNFDPSEKLDKETMYNIAKTYMQGIGFKEQPYLLYQHFDAAHPHLHIVSTNIQDGGKRIPLHYIGEKQSEQIRKEIEKAFHLIPASSKNKIQEYQQEQGKKQEQKQEKEEYIKPVTYGKSETKAAISNTVRAVVRDYKFASLAELNAVLNLYNVTAYRGEEGSKMFEKKGLNYFVLDDKVNRIGVPIKASSIYTNPTLSNLEKKFEANRNQKQPHKESLKKMIDYLLQFKFIPDKEALKEELAKKNIDIIFRENASMIYGITFIDHNSKTVFNGSDVGKEYSAKRIMERIGVNGLVERKERNASKDFVEKILKETDYSKGIPSALASLYAKGLRIKVDNNEDEQMAYYLGKQFSKEATFTKADWKLMAWFTNNRISPNVIDKLNLESENQINNTSLNTQQWIQHLAECIQNFLSVDEQSIAPTIGGELPKIKKRKPNW